MQDIYMQDIYIHIYIYLAALFTRHSLLRQVAVI